MKTHPHRRESQGAVLVTTLIVLTVLAVVAVAFMQSTSMDQLSSRSASGSYRAQLAADAGAAVARGELARLVTRFPDSVTVWQNIGGGSVNGTNNEATVLYARSNVTQPTNPARPGQFGSEVAFVGFPLVSRTNSDGIPVDAFIATTNGLTFATTNPLMVNLNATNASRPEAFIGERSMTNAGAPVAAAQWVYIGASPGPTNATNPAVARYAYWIEDESFKVNVNTGTNGARAQGTNVGPNDVRLDGSWQSSPNAALRQANATAVVADRGTNAKFFPTAGSAAIAAGLSSTTSAAEFRFLTTANSAGLDLTRGGFKRFNLNTLTNGVTTDALKRTALNRLLLAITNTNAAPLFGQRFYRLPPLNVPNINNTSAVTADHANIYLQKIAANIYDYLDSDDQPTIINNDATNVPPFTLRTGRPTDAIYSTGNSPDGTNSVAAFGVENFPRLQEWAMHARVWRMSWTNGPDSRSNFGFVNNATNPAANPTSANYEIWLDYYFEFYNPGTRDITVSNAFVTLDKLPAFDGPGSSDPLASERSITNIPLNATFPAGQITVLTTAAFGEDSHSAGNSSGGILTNRANVVYLPVATNDRKFTGTTTGIAVQTYDPVGDKLATPSPNFNRLFQVAMKPGPQTKGSILIGNDAGILESFVGLPFNAQTDPNVSGLPLRIGLGWIRNGMMTIGDGNNDNARVASLRGNSSDANARPSATEGDPRALNEQLEFFNFDNGGNPDQSRFWTSFPRTGTDVFPGAASVGSLNTNYVFATNWTDSTAWQLNPNNAPLFVRNASMQSIGELGHITDPARASTNNIARARGGGRTLRIGQPELTNAAAPWRMAWSTGSQTNASRTWTSWRLADIFTVTTNTNVAIPGLINPNGALRDNGAALRAALFGLTFLPASAEGATSIAGRPANVTNVVTNVIARLTNGSAAGLTNALNPFWERGELSELSVLNSAASGSLASGAVMSNAFDRGREELVRRSIEMITTRGSVFTVYAIGQALQIPTNASGAPLATNVLGTASLKSTFEMTPQFISAAATNDAFNPASVAGVNQRFSPPTNYTTRVISSTYD